MAAKVVAAHRTGRAKKPRQADASWPVWPCWTAPTREGCSPGRFALVRSVTERLPAPLRAALLEQGWREGDAVTAISDRDPALPALVRSSTVLDGCYGLWPAGHPTRGVAPQILDAPLRAVAAGL